MKRFSVAMVLVAFAWSAQARQPKTYQVTGDVLEVADDLVVVQKGKEKFEIARTADTKVTGDLKAGAKATVEYRMTATTADVKAAKGGAEKKDGSAKKDAGAAKKGK